ncbi:MAG: hemerythrin [Candidatus Dadabacteria bacterium]|nr:MAG: hemerythrin [Candidatus Dadabacteria bacterium]
MDPIETLMDEHRRIEKALDALDVYAERLQAGAQAPLDDLAGFVRFIREFADRTHHGKEEDILFEAMVAAGFPKEAGPIAVMLAEHDEGRSYVAELAAAVEAGTIETNDRARLAGAARGYTSLLRDHIQKEDNVLYPMARARLSSEAYAEVTRRCQEYERLHESEKAELTQLAIKLCDQYRP